MGAFSASVVEAEPLVGGSAPMASVSGRNICVLVHGMGGDANDWEVWVELLTSRFPSWVVWPLKTLANGCRFMGLGLDALEKLAAEEIVEAIRSIGQSEHVTLHCIGHSMGGLIVRGALAHVLDTLAPRDLQLGHYLSLSSPHLGIQASWAAPLQLWRNLCVLSRPISSQLAQLAIQDTAGPEQPYLVALGDASGRPVEILRRFRRCTCVTLASGDPLIPLPSGVIEPERRFNGSDGLRDRAFWQILSASGLGSSLEQELAVGRPHCGPPVESLTTRIFAGCPRRLRAASGFEGQSSLAAAKGAPLHPAAHDPECEEVPIVVDGRRADDFEPREQTIGKPELEPFSADNCEEPAESAEKLDREWRTSADGSCRFPGGALRGLEAIPWQRIVVQLHFPFAWNAHVFLIGKGSEQRSAEHTMSEECIASLVEILAE